MIVIGLTGGVASGKSLAARQLSRLGAAVVDADRLGHDVLETPEVRRALRRWWGDEAFDAEGRVDRAAVARRVFAPGPEGRAALERLERLTHPRIAQRLRDRLEALAAAGAPAVVLDAPVLFKAGWDALCDYVVFVDAPWAERVRRAAARGWSEQQLAAREAAQTPLDEKRRRADLVVDNSGPPERLAQQLDQWWRRLGIPGPPAPARRRGAVE